MKMKRRRAGASPASSKLYKIHPAIGIARLGNADPDEFFIGPETPRLPATGEALGTTVPPFKDDAGRIKPQGARFRIFEYARVRGKYAPTREINLDREDVEKIEWAVHLANRKASFHRFEGEKGEKRPPAPRRNPRVPARQLEIDPGPRQIAGRMVGGVQFTPGTSAQPDDETWPRYPGPHPPKGAPVIDYLGELRTDDAGRLIVLGGRGKSASNAPKGPKPLSDYANNNTWFDDISDGPVTAEVKFRGGPGGAKTTITALGSWVLVGPPDFAPHIQAPVSLFDLLYDLAARKLRIPRDNSLYDGPLKNLKQISSLLKSNRYKSLQGYRVDFNEEIYPIIQNAINMRWVYGPAKSAHAKMGVGDMPHGHMGAAHNQGVSLHVHETEASIWPVLSDPGPAGKKARAFVFGALRPLPGFKLPKDGMGDMPRLFGDAPYTRNSPRARLTVTLTQYLLLKLWMEGKFRKPARTPPAPATAVRITPDGLDRAALENCTGGPFYPGIEASWQIRHAELFVEPFRIDHAAKSTYYGESRTIRAGHFSRQMAVPWQADFNDCAKEGAGEEEFGWWPSQRPDDVFVNADAVETKAVVAWARPYPDDQWPSGNPLPSRQEMVENWFELGFVIKRGGDFVESERAKTVP